MGSLRRRNGTLSDLSLTPGDLQVLNIQDSEGCLNDKHIDAFLYIVQKSTNYRPQSSLYNQLPQFIRAVDPGESYLQILYERPRETEIQNGDPAKKAENVGHWITICYRDSVLFVYDSANRNQLGKDQKTYVNRLFPDQCPEIRYCRVQYQPNDYDCGVFAMAFATSIIYGRDPETERYDHSRMRSTAREILGMKWLVGFPTLNSTVTEYHFNLGKRGKCTVSDNRQRPSCFLPEKKQEVKSAPKENIIIINKDVKSNFFENKFEDEIQVIEQVKLIKINDVEDKIMFKEPTAKKPRGRPPKRKKEEKAKENEVKERETKKPVLNIINKDLKSNFFENKFEDEIQVIEQVKLIKINDIIDDKIMFKEPIAKKPRGRPPKGKKGEKAKEDEVKERETENKDVKSNFFENKFEDEIQVIEQVKLIKINDIIDDKIMFIDDKIMFKEPIAKKPRGRPPKGKKGEKAKEEEIKERETEKPVLKKGPGRPSKKMKEPEQNVQKSTDLEPPPKKGPGRPKKKKPDDSDKQLENFLKRCAETVVTKKGPGRPPKRKHGPGSTSSSKETGSVASDVSSNASEFDEMEIDDQDMLEQQKSEKRLQQKRDWARRHRAQETEEEREKRLAEFKDNTTKIRENESQKEKERRLIEHKEYLRNQMEIESEVERAERLEKKKINDKEKRKEKKIEKEASNRPVAREPVANEADVEVHYAGPMTATCQFCLALHFEAERCADKNFNSCCHRGKVLTPPPQTDYPEELCKLLTGNLGDPAWESEEDDPAAISPADCRNFRNNIRSYNTAFSFLSLQAGIESPRNRTGPYVFRIHGGMYHSIGPLRPGPGTKEKYAQLYIVDTAQALENRLREPSNSGCKENIFRILDEVLRRVNPYAKAFQTMAEVEKKQEEEAKAKNTEPKEVKMFIVKGDPATHDHKRYNQPTSDEVAVVFTGDDGAPPAHIDFRVYPRNRPPYKVSDTSPNCDAMRYPVFFPRGRWGWHPGLLQANGKKKCTALQYYSNILAVRNEFSPISRGGKLFQEYIVGSYVKVEAERMRYIREHQSDLRAELYAGLMDHINNVSAAEGMVPGKMVILPSTFIGSPRNVQQQYQDAMAIVQKCGKPDIFLTMTCNPAWPEIVENLHQGQTASDRPDLVARVFDIKFNSMVQDIVDNGIIGTVTAYVFVVEFQQRGLPHVHALFTVQEKIRTAEDIDNIVSAEIPNQDTHPQLYDIVKSCMVHGPCGPRCMEDGKCKKRFPKQFQEETIENMDGYPLYRRRNDGRYVMVKGQKLDNRWIVPYNAYLSLKYKCHINVEICSSIKSVKYLHKYIHKGHDSAVVNIRKQGTMDWDEINAFIQARYVCAPEAAHRLMEKKMHDQSHAIIRLAIHLPDQQSVVFKPGEEKKALSRNCDTTLTAWFKLNQTDPGAQELYYRDLPQHYVWDNAAKAWKKRKLFRKPVIGRIHAVSPKDVERFYLRLLLLHVKGATGWAHLRTVEGTEYPTFKEAAIAMHLVEDDEEWRRCLSDGARTDMPRAMRQLFAYICLFGNPRDALELWNEFKHDLCEDFLHRGKSPTVAENKALREIYETLYKNGSSPKDFNLPDVPPDDGDDDNDNDDDQGRNENEIDEYLANMSDSLNDDQKLIYDKVMAAVRDDDARQRLFYMDGPGGTGKTFLYNAIIGELRRSKIPVIAVAWTGIAATLLRGGRTSHNAFRFPVPLNETSTSSVKPNSKAGADLRNVKCIIWDEITVAPKQALKILDELLRDLTKVDRPFGGKVILLGGDFRQCLPVVKHGTPADVVETCVKRSYLWPLFETLSLKKNMRVNPQEVEFAEWLLKIGSGKWIKSDGDDEEFVSLPSPDMLSKDLVDDVFRDINTVDYYNRVILCAINDDALAMNEKVLEKLHGDERTYLSVDTIVKEDQEQGVPIEFINSTSAS